MIPTFKIPYREDDELRIGWASWDDGTLKARSIKFAYRDSSGKISRGSPEVPFDVLVDMLVLAADQGELAAVLPRAAVEDCPDISQQSLQELRGERKALSVALTRIQRMMAEIPWADWGPVHDQIGARLNAVREEIFKR